MNCWTTLHIYIIQGQLIVFLIPVKVPFLKLCFPPCLPPYLSILEHPEIIKYFKGVYNLRSPTQKITFVWDVQILFDYFNRKWENDQISDKCLTQKLLILLLLLGGPKTNTAYFFTVDRMTVTDIAVTFSPNHVLKQPKAGKKLSSFHYRAYHNKKLCCRLF